MEQKLTFDKQFVWFRLNKVPLYSIVVFLIFPLAVLQDFIFSHLKNTGFYLSESFLYNTFWLFFIPLTFLVNHIINKVNPSNEWIKSPFNIFISVLVSFFHTLLFTSFFILISNLAYSPPHRFSSIFKTVLANQFYFALLWYLILPVLYKYKTKSGKSATQYLKEIKLKKGARMITVPTSFIQFISKDKPYTIIVTEGHKYLENKSLKEFETILDPSTFIRVHRSFIVNKNFIKEIVSRNNGDYDALLKNGQSIRLSRHFRKSWIHLLQ